MLMGDVGRAGLVAISASVLIVACDPMPMISLKNETVGPVVVRFGASAADDHVPQATYELKERRFARFPAGYSSSLLLVDDGRCLRTYPILPEAGIDGGMGGNTRLAIGSDWRLYVREPSAQPKGYPLAAVAKRCR
jgi:hypothetical protein